MRLFRILLAHELRMLLVSPATYIAATLFLLVMGFVFAGILETFTAAPQEAAPAAVFFQLFWLPVFFMVPLLTMKSIAEERRLGTLETLLTTPVSTPQVVLAKFAASYALYLACGPPPEAFSTSLSASRANPNRSTSGPCSAATFLSPCPAPFSSPSAFSRAQ